MQQTAQSIKKKENFSSCYKSDFCKAKIIKLNAKETIAILPVYF